MELWSFLLDLLILLGAAMLLGMVCEQLRLSAIVGYLLAGTLLGPNVFGLTQNPEAVSTIAELGVALLLFSIGLEFSWRRLRGWGPRVWVGGLLQLVLTILFFAAAFLLSGESIAASVTIGAIIALSSTSVVLRTLEARAEIDSVYGRSALGVLLLQDVAVVPLVLLVTALGGGGGVRSVVFGLGKEVGLAALLVAAFFVLSNYVLPRLLASKPMSRNRELPILFAFVTALGSAWAANAIGLSPALGAFVAGVVLGESPMSTQIRADIGVLRTLFVTLFFSSIGMLADVAWVLGNPALFGVVVAAVIGGKVAVIWAIGLLLRVSPRHAMATGLCLAQVGEFSFVLAQVAQPGPDRAGVIDEDLFNLMVSVTIATLFLTPFLIAVAPRVGRTVAGWLGVAAGAMDDAPMEKALNDHVVIIGFGPAGRAVAEAIRRHSHQIVVVDLNPQSVTAAKLEGLSALVGDALSPDLLEHIAVRSAIAVVVTLPHHRATLDVIRQVRAMAPNVQIIARARYGAYAGELSSAGAHAVVDEERSVGRRLGAALRQAL